MNYDEKKGAVERDQEVIDMSDTRHDRKQSIVLKEAADLYGNVEDAESESQHTESFELPRY